MVATIVVLDGPVVQISDYFQHDAASDIGGYYRAERPGLWFGKGADRLGLIGQTEGDDFELVLAGHDPSGKPLIPRRKLSKQKRKPNKKNPPGDGPPEDVPKKKTKKRRERVPGYDVCFSASKTLSILWLVASDKVREIIEHCLLSAVKKTLGDLEEFLPLARRSKGGGINEFAELVVSMFLHTLSRAGDPQLHIHCVIANLCYGDDDRWSSVNSSMLHEWTPALGRIFRCHLAKELTSTLGLALERPSDDQGQEQSWFEVAGVPKELVDEFSKRRKEIERIVGKKNLADSKARQRANLDTRQSKANLPDMESLAREWRNKTDQYGFNQFSVESLLHKSLQEPITQQEIDEAFNLAIKRSSDGRAHFGESLIVQNVCEILQHRSVDPTTLIPQLRQKMERTNQLVTLEDSIGRQRFTTKEYWEVEKRLLAFVDSCSLRTGAVVPQEIVDKILRSNDRLHGSKLSDEQKDAVSHLLTSKGAIRCLTGVAGSGKTLVLDAVRRGFEHQGYRVIGAALAGKATAGLQGSANIESRTVASYLYNMEKTVGDRLKEQAKHHARMLVRQLIGKKTYRHQKVSIAKKSVLIVDESSMLDTRTMTRLLHHADKAKATVILVGDDNQLPGIDAGGPAKHIAEKLGDSTLSTNRRQRNQDDRDAVKQVRKGEMIEALENYAERDRLTITESPHEMVQRVVETWASQGGLKEPEKHIVVTQTRNQAAEINIACQKKRFSERSSLPGFSVSLGENRFYVDDRVLFHKSIRHLGVENGFTGTVLNVDPLRGRITVHLDQVPSKKAQATGTADIVSVPLRRLDKSDVTLGYAATTHKLQGATVDHAYILLAGRMLSKEMVYTQLTRARETTHLFVDKKSAGKQLETLANNMKRSVQKDLAHDVNPNATARTTSIDSDPMVQSSLEQVISQFNKARDRHATQQSTNKSCDQEHGEKQSDSKSRDQRTEPESRQQSFKSDVAQSPQRVRSLDR